MNTDFFRLIGHLVRSYPRRSALVVLLSLMAGLAEGLGIVTLLPLLDVAGGEPGQGSSPLTQAVRDALDRAGLDPSVGLLLGLVVLGMFLKGGFLWLASRQIGYTVAFVATDLRLSLIRALLKARWSYFVGERAGQVSNAVGMEANRAASAYAAACSLVAILIQVVVYTAIVLAISPTVAVGALAVGALLGFTFMRLVRMSQEAGRRQTALIRTLSGRLVDALQGLKPIKAMAQEDHLQPLLEGETSELNEAQRRQVLAAGTMSAFHEPLLVMMLAIGLYLALEFTQVPLAALIVTAFLFHRLVSQIHRLQLTYQTVVSAESAYWSIRDAIDRADAERETTAGAAATPPRLERSLRMEDVRFSYGEAEVLRGVTLDVPAGAFVTIVGPSGAGKTTIVDLLIGLYRPTAGRIMVDDVSLDQIELRAWRKRVGYVPQEMLLFHESVYRNVTLGDLAISRERVQEALQAAGADFVHALPADIDTVVGERGSRLSGGQRQRIAIARALVRDPQLLVLDEVTTALDPATEQGICDTLRQLAGRVTILAISHQPALTRIADIVYHLEAGRVQRRDGVAPMPVGG